MEHLSAREYPGHDELAHQHHHQLAQLVHLTEVSNTLVDEINEPLHFFRRHRLAPR